MKRFALLLTFVALIALLCSCSKPYPKPSYGGNLNSDPTSSDNSGKDPCLDGHDFSGDAANCLVCDVDYFSATLQFKMTDDRNSYIVTGLGTCTRSEIAIPATHKGKPVSEIATTAFSGMVNPICQTITKVTVPSSVTKMGTNVFHKCLSLTSVELPEGLVTIGVDSFRECTALESIRIPSTVTEIGERMFYLCDNLKNVEFAGDITSIGTSAFQQCFSMESIEIPDSLKKLGVSAFYGCTALKSFSMPSGIEEVGRQVFDNCDALQYNIHGGMAYLGNEQEPYIILMKRADENQKEVVIHSDTRLMLVTALENLDITSLTINAGLTVPYNGLRSLPMLRTIEVEDGHPIYHTSGNCLIETATKTLVRGTSTSVIPTDGSVTSIGLSAFGGLKELTTIVIPDVITVIGNGAFGNCTNLQTVVFGAGVTKVELSSFSGCSNFTVYYAGTASQWNLIDIPAGAGGGGLSFGDNDALLNAPRYYYSETEPDNGIYYWHYVDGKPTRWAEEESK